MNRCYDCQSVIKGDRTFCSACAKVRRRLYVRVKKRERRARAALSAA